MSGWWQGYRQVDTRTAPACGGEAGAGIKRWGRGRSAAVHCAGSVMTRKHSENHSCSRHGSGRASLSRRIPPPANKALMETAAGARVMRAHGQGGHTGRRRSGRRGLTKAVTRTRRQRHRPGAPAQHAAGGCQSARVAMTQAERDDARLGVRGHSVLAIVVAAASQPAVHAACCALENAAVINTYLQPGHAAASNRRQGLAGAISVPASSGKAVRKNSAH